MMLRLFAVVLALLLVVPASAPAEDKSNEGLSAAELFDARIMPIFRSPNPSSCVQCHLSSVDLKNYILPSHEKTILSLRDQGLVNPDAPEKSKILTLIRMGDKDLDKGAKLIHEKTRRAEYEAFVDWIRACCTDERLLSLPPLSPEDRARPKNPDPVIRHARRSRVVDSFVRNIWSQRMRCFPCHTPHDIDKSNPRHQVAIRNMEKFKKQYPVEVLERLDIFRETTEATLASLIEKSRAAKDGERPMLDLKQPEQSLLILKPMSKIPKKRADGTFEIPRPGDPSSHMGGLKMHKDDQSYKAFVAWIRDYSNVVGNRYASVEDLPADNWFATKLVLRLTSAPEGWKVGTPVQLFVHRWNEETESWDDSAVAFTQGTVTPRRIINGMLFRLGPADPRKAAGLDRENARLPRGRYQVRVCVDQQGRLEKDPALLLGKDDYVGQAVIRSARWREGFRQAETVSASALRR